MKLPHPALDWGLKLQQVNALLAHLQRHGVVLLGLLVNIALIEWAGFIIASTAMFPLVARGFGSRAPLRDAAIGFVLSCVSYVGFDRVLGYKIGTGFIENLI